MPKNIFCMWTSLTIKNESVDREFRTRKLYLQSKILYFILLWKTLTIWCKIKGYSKLSITIKNLTLLGHVIAMPNTYNISGIPKPKNDEDKRKNERFKRWKVSEYGCVNYLYSKTICDI